jgi:ribosomal protein S18 acetylase RimI-like enzyme
MEALALAFEPAADPAVRKIIIDGVDLHNVAATGHDAYHPITFVLRTARGEIAGGLTGFLWGGWLQVQNLWIARPFRHQGHANRLMDAAEAYAVERGCVGATLETHSFQAPALYRKRGYEVFATLEGYPPGHAKHFLRKPLGPAR